MSWSVLRGFPPSALLASGAMQKVPWAGVCHCNFDTAMTNEAFVSESKPAAAFANASLNADAWVFDTNVWAIVPVASSSASLVEMLK